MNFKKIWVDPVWSKVISAVIIGGGITAWASVHWWEKLQHAWGVTLGFLAADISLPRWLLLLMICWIVGTVGVIAITFISARGEPVSDWRSYNEDMFLGLRWRWKIDFGNPTLITSFCPECDYPLDNYLGHKHEGCTKFVCSHCAKTLVSIPGDINFIENRIYNLIQLSVRNGSWRKAGRRVVAA
jgi:hypothetical protein